LRDRNNRYECDVDDQVRKKQAAEAAAVEITKSNNAVKMAELVPLQ
jgi:hypothetical protein